MYVVMAMAMVVIVMMVIVMVMTVMVTLMVAVMLMAMAMVLMVADVAMVFFTLIFWSCHSSFAGLMKLYAFIVQFVNR